MNAQIPKSYLDHIEIQGFRSLKNTSADLSPLTVLIGSNGAGKSNFIKFFGLMRWLIDGRSLHEWTVREGGADDQLFMGQRIVNQIFSHLRISTCDPEGQCMYTMHIQGTNNNQLSLSEELIKYLTPDSQSTQKLHKNRAYDITELPSAVQNEKLPEEARGVAKRIARFLRQCRVYQFHDTSKHAAIKKSHDISDSVYLNTDGGNLAAVLLGLSEYNAKRLQLIERQIRRVLPVFDGFVLEPQHGKIMLRWRHRQGDKVMGAHLTSDGSLRLFFLITLLNLPVEQLPDVILLDEPELGLHPNAVTLIAAMIQRISLNSQVILATQSPLLVDCFDLENIIVADLEEGATRLRNLKKEAYQQWLDDEFSVSELWLSNVLGGQP